MSSPGPPTTGVGVGEALVTDLYELNMAASFLHRGMVERATYSLFVRRFPPTRGFLVVAGLEDCLDYLESFAFSDDDLIWFSDDDLIWLAQAGFPAETVERFETLRFTGDVEAVPEGRVVFANEPILEVTTPIAEAQLVETFLLNQVTYQCALATKAARCRLAAGDIELIDFALRRTHGTEAGMAVARVSAIAGFAATSNVEAPGDSASWRRAPWPTPTWRRSRTRKRRSPRSPGISRAKRPSWSTPTTHSPGSTRRSRSSAP